MFYLDIFPASGLSQSLHATIFVGLIIFWLLHERFGFPLAGMVVPGYFGPLILIQPLSAALIFLEAIVTYYFVLLVSEVLGKTGIWYPLFGRDRFFVFLYGSIVVRLLTEGLIIPQVGPLLTQTSALPLDFTYSFSSVGLICTALFSNAFYKVGIRHGLAVVTLPVALTTLFIAFVLIPFTDFNLIRLEYLYEELASHIAASPKAYIFLLLGAFLASQANLKYGWDFSGILVPALLALTVFDWVKLVITLSEAMVIFVLYLGVIRLPWIRTLNLTGARPLIVCASIAFALKLIEGYAVDIISLQLEQEINALDYYGFGYLLSSLLAAKMATKARVVGTMLPVVRTALIIVIVANVVGVMIIQIRQLVQPPAVAATDTSAVKTTTYTVPQVLAQERVRIRRSTTPLPPDRFTPADLAALDSGFRMLDESVSTAPGIGHAKATFSSIGLDLVYLQPGSTGPGYALIREPTDRPDEERKGWGAILYTLNSDSKLIVTVPRPLSERQTLAIGGALFENRRAKMLVFPGTHYLAGIRVRADVLHNPNLLFGAVHHIFADHEFVQIRGSQDETTIHYKGKWSGTLYGNRNDRGAFQADWIGVPELHSGLLDPDDQLHKLSRNLYATLLLTPAHRRSLLRRLLLDPGEVGGDSPLLRLPLRAVLDEHVERLPGPGTNSYAAPDIYDRMLFDEEILQPLLSHIHEPEVPDQIAAYAGGLALGLGINKETTARELRALLQHGCRASTFSMEMIEDPDTGRTSVVLAGTPGEKSRGWGVYVFSLSANALPLVVQCPGARTEIGSYGLAVDMYQKLGAAALMIPGAALNANVVDGLADVTDRNNPRTMYQLVYRRVLSTLGFANAVTVELDGYDGGADQPDVVIGRGDEGAHLDRADDYGMRAVLSYFLDQGHRVVLAQTVPELAVNLGLSVQAAMAGRYRVEHYSVVCSREMRRQYERPRGHARRLSLLEAVGIPRANVDTRAELFASEHLKPQAHFIEQATKIPERLAAIDDMIRRYQETGDINALRALRDEAARRGAVLLWFADRQALLDFIIFREADAVGLFQLSLPASFFAGDHELQATLPAVRRVRRWWFDPDSPRLQAPMGQ